MTAINSIPTGAISVLFGSTSSQLAATTPVSQAQTFGATGKTDNALKTGGAIGKIIEIDAGMSDGAKVVDVTCLWPSRSLAASSKQQAASSGACRDR